MSEFRVYCKSMGKMGDVAIINYMLGTVTAEIEGRGYLLQEPDYILMQSTGLKDKNGKEIFEGDIIVAMSQGVKAIGKVKRRIDGCWLMYPVWQHGELWYIVDNVDTGETGVEVLGNIYETPEFLEEVE